MQGLLRERQSCGKPAHTSAFTLVEMLVSTAVLTLLLTFVFRMLSGTTATISASNKQLDTASLARIVLDRIGNDLSGALLTGGATALYFSEPGNDGNSSIGFVSGSRARGPTTQTAPWTTDTRSAFIGYKVRAVSQYVGGGSANIPSLNRGDGRFTFSTQDSASLASYRLWDVFGTGNLRMPNDLTAIPPANDEASLNWQIIASGVFRMHITFVLDDGRLVQAPPAFRNFFANGGTGTSVPVAFSKYDSADANGRFVKGVIVGVAILDEATRNLAYHTDNVFWTTVGNQISRPTLDGQSPTQLWNQNLSKVTFQPVRQNIRFYQRFFGLAL